MGMDPMDGRGRVKRPEPSIVVAGLVITIFPLMTGSGDPVASVMAMNDWRMVQLWNRFYSDWFVIPVMAMVVVEPVMMSIISFVVSVVVSVVSVIAIMMVEMSVSFGSGRSFDAQLLFCRVFFARFRGDFRLQRAQKTTSFCT